MNKLWAQVRKDLYVVRLWVVAVVVVLLGDLAIRAIESSRPQSDFWWDMVERADTVTVPLALLLFAGLVISLFQEDRMDEKPAFWQVRPCAPQRLLLAKALSVCVITMGMWTGLSLCAGDWSTDWLAWPLAVAGLSGVASVLLPGWKRLALGLTVLAGLFWFGQVWFHWLWFKMVPDVWSGEFNGWLGLVCIGLLAWCTVWIHSAWRRAVWTRIGLAVSCLLSIAVGAMVPGGDRGDDLHLVGGEELADSSEILDELILLIDSTGNYGAGRSYGPAGNARFELRRLGRLIGLPPKISARIAIKDARLQFPGGDQISTGTRFWAEVDRAGQLFPGYEPRNHQDGAPGDGFKGIVFAGELPVRVSDSHDGRVSYNAEAEVWLSRPEIVFRSSAQEPGQWRDGDMAVRLREDDGWHTIEERVVRATCLPRRQLSSTLKGYLVRESGGEIGQIREKYFHRQAAELEGAEVVLVRARPFASRSFKIAMPGFHVYPNDAPPEDLVVAEDLSRRDAEVHCAKVLSWRKHSQSITAQLLNVGSAHVEIVLRSSMLVDQPRREACRQACITLLGPSHRALAGRYNQLDFDLTPVIVKHGWLDHDVLESMMDQAEASLTVPLPETWIEAFAKAAPSNSRAGKVLAERLEMAFLPQNRDGFIRGPLLYDALKSLPGYPLKEVVDRGWKNFRHDPMSSPFLGVSTEAPLVSIGISEGQPGALVIGASLAEAGSNARRGSTLPESLATAPSLFGKEPLISVDPTLTGEERRKLKELLLRSCEFPPEAKYDELYWIQDHAKDLVYDVDTKKWALPKP